MKLRLAQNNLVLLPGLDGTGSLLTTFANALPPEFSVTAVTYPPDQPLTYDELVPRIREAIPWGNPYAIVAESFAGPLALEFVAAHPSNVQAVILVGSFVTNPLPSMLKWVTSFLKPRWWQKAVPEHILRKFFVGEDATPALVNQFSTALQNVKPSVLAQRVKMALATDARAAVKSCPVPVYYLLGKRDALVGKRGWAEIKRARKDAVCTVIDGPHMLLEARPRESAVAVSDIANTFQDHSRIKLGSRSMVVHQSQ